MTIHGDALVRVLLSDFANTDAAGKLNLIGGGISMMGFGPEGLTVPFSVCVITNVPAKYAGEQYALSVELYDETRKQVVKAPGQTGQQEAMRVQQMVDVDHIQLGPGVRMPNDAQSQNIMIMNFPSGMPLLPGTYDWRAQIEGQTRAGWFARFHVLEPAPGPIFGGPAGSSDIGGVAPPFSEDRDISEAEKPETPE